MKQLSEEVTNRLLYDIVHGEFANERFLPPEQELAKRYDVSRTSIRDSLSRLDREGFISRKHGIGTIINRHVLNIKTRMDVEKEFLPMVEDAGYEAEITDCSVKEEAADRNIAEKLSLNPNETVIAVDRIITADGSPAIYCIDYIPKSMIRNHQYRIEELEKPIFYFIGKYCNKTAHLDITQIKAIVTDEYLADRLGVEIGKPILYFDEVDYDFWGMPILYSKQFFVGDYLVNTLIRQEI